MRKKIYFFLAFLFFLLGKPSFTWAANNEVNKVGIHLASPIGIHKASELVNSNGGDWGYITVVMAEKDLDHGMWQKFFDDCREKHIIPLIRIATFGQGDGTWIQPDFDHLEKWPAFLNSLNWPVKQQTVIIFNEPNHAQEWGGIIDPAQYAQTLSKLIKLFKEANPNFFILAAGLDQAAGNTPMTQDGAAFLKTMAQSVPDIFNQLDGWASHSYPNHGFVGSPQDTGRTSIRGYEWELNLLKQLGLTKELPVFITETGWPHQEGQEPQLNLYSTEETAIFWEKAWDLWLNDPKVQAITPFILNYPMVPFDHFSWLAEDGQPYPQFNQVLGMTKKNAEPEQVQNFSLEEIKITDILPTDYSYQGKVTIKNNGQWIMGEREIFQLIVDQTDPQIEISQIELPQGELLYPGKEKTLEFTLKTGSQSSEHRLTFKDKEHTLYVFKPWDLKNTKVNLFKQIWIKIKLALNLN